MPIEMRAEKLRSDKQDITELLHRERNARDAGRWDEMASYYHPDSSIEVSWLRGSGAEFCERSRKQAERARQRPDGAERTNFHEIGTTVVDIQHDRALADMQCTLHSFFPLDGVACKMTGFTRLLWRAQRLEGRWLIAGLRCVYVRDLITACNPSRQPVIDEAELATYRLSYRFVCYNLARLGLETQNDLPGEDMPETVAKLRAGETAWLQDS